MAPARKTKRTVSDEHKAALAEGRDQGRKVRVYLEALETHRPTRGRKRTPESIQSRLDKIEENIIEAAPLARLQLIQERLDLQAELASMSEPVDLSAIEADFVSVAKGYSGRKGISYQAWREIGVEASVLKKAGIGRGAS